MTQLDLTQILSQFVKESPEDQRAELTDDDVTNTMAFELSWQHNGIKHSMVTINYKVNLWRDIFPFALDGKLKGLKVGDVFSHDFTPGNFIPEFDKYLATSVRTKQFNTTHRLNTIIEPKVGRFYPKGFIAGTHNIYPEDITPFRITAIDDKISIDLNHALAQTAVSFKGQILDIWMAKALRGGSCNDIAELASKDAGLQCQYQDQETDFWSGIPFARMMDSDDAKFYSKTHTENDVDGTAQGILQQAYRQLLTPSDTILDLMTGRQSYLIEHSGEVIGLGLNDAAMCENSELESHFIHDVNATPELPFSNNQFDSAICSFSVEYLTQPIAVFEQIKRTVKPGGLFAIAISNRYQQEKVTQLWQDLHEQERVGFVLELMKKAGFDNLNSWSLNGLYRPDDDPRIKQSVFADPIFVIWGQVPKH
ncbi:MAG: methyltransferase domain-containing protein [Methylococcales bacterium]|jgi:SAM-dependent methyltransferase|nr:methyltransferase domain-containing protein [Methylococcales bacterium]